MSEQDNKLETPVADQRQSGEVLLSRRRLVKGGAFAAPVLLTLPKGAALAATSNVAHCVGAAVNPTPGSPPGINAAGYVSVPRESYELANGHTVVNVSTTAELGDWHKIDNWGITYTKSGGQFFLGGSGSAIAIASGPVTVSVIVHVDSQGQYTGAIGPANNVHVLTTSCWNSVLPTGSLP